VSKIQRVMDACLAVFREHQGQAYGLPTNPRFVAYELEQQGKAVKPDPTDQRPNKRRSHGWPPGFQDVQDAILRLREEGTIPWKWVTDADRRLVVFDHAPTVAEYMAGRLDEATISPWHPGLPPLVLTEAKGLADVLTNPVGAYACPIAGLKGQAGKGWLVTEVAPKLLAGNDREVLYLGDLDKSGTEIEQNARRVLGTCRRPGDHLGADRAHRGPDRGDRADLEGGRARPHRPLGVGSRVTRPGRRRAPGTGCPGRPAARAARPRSGTRAGRT
jgi:hypothetical protein